MSTTERCWRFINPPAKEKDLIGKWFAFIYTSKKVQHVYIGKVMMRFLSDAVEDKRVYGSLPNGLPQTKVWGY